MGRRSKEPTSVAPSAQDTTAIQKQYQDSLAAVQAQSDASLAAVQKANADSQAAIQQQTQQQAQAQQSQQQQLTLYLQQLAATQQEQQAAVAKKDSAITANQAFERQSTLADSAQNNLLASTQASNAQFKQSTSRKRGFIS